MPEKKKKILIYACRGKKNHHYPRRYSDQSKEWQVSYGPGRSNQHTAQPCCPNNTVGSDPEGPVLPLGHNSGKAFHIMQETNLNASV